MATTGYETFASARSLRCELAAGPGLVGRCRDLTRRVLTEWYGTRDGPDRDAVEDVLLLVSELVTNACTHGGAPYELRLDRAGERFWVQVSDLSPARPHPHGPHRPGRASGHGLYLLERLSDAWGWLPRGDGKAVWFEKRMGLGRRPADGAPAADGTVRDLRV